MKRLLKVMLILASGTGVIQASVAASGEAERIVAAGGAVTEIIYALGQGDKVVGTDISSLWPSEVSQLPRIGYLRTLSAEGILALHPTLLLTTTEAGPPATLEHLRASHVRIETVSSGFTPESVETKLAAVAKALAISEKGQQHIERFRAEWQKTQAGLAVYPDKPRVLFVLAHTGGSPMVAGRNTAADAMIALAKAENAAASFEGYKPLTAEAAAMARPDVILITDEGIKELGGMQSLWNNAALSLTPAGKHRRAVSMDSLYLLGFGPRLPEAVTELATQLRQAAKP
jgi:iron complex transport system substrate-binding protein